ncbi:hypothetical protein EK904_006385 [Melospiza melodia maxima]|nr:hypothetical protein EK904_006385 [Melospiza melodia maxima]
MKSNQERSNECLPPKKREIPATSLPSEVKPVLPNENHRADNLAWLPSTPSGQGCLGGRHRPGGTSSVEAGLQQGLHKSLSAGMDYSPPSAPRSVPASTTLPTVYSPALSQSGTPVSPVQYTHLQHTFQFVGPQYSGSYTGFIPSQLISPTANSATGAVAAATAVATTPSQRSQLEAYSTLLASMSGLSQQGHKVEPHLPPVIGYLSGQQQAIGYPGSLPQHLVIPGTQSLLIPVGSADVEPSGVTPAIVTSSPQFAAVPHTFVTTAVPKSENFSAEPLTTQPAYQATMVQAQIHLPVVQSIASPAAAPPTLPPYFMKGSIIQLANGELKKVEDLKTEDFIQSAEISNDLKIDSSTVERIEDSHSPGIAVIQFAVGEHRAQVSVEVLVEYPFFVFGQGWSSCCPERTNQLFDLPCSKLSVGDVCISLTLKNLKNGSIKKGQPMDSASILLKHSKNDSLAGSRHRYAEQENGINQGSAQMLAENGELKFPDKIGLPAAPLLTKTEPSKPPATRKRRWSAPETRKLEKSEEEPPLTLPKPSFIPQEVKICIEGRSNVGK